MPRSGNQARVANLAGWRGPLLVWAVFGLVTVAILVTYARIPTTELYHVSRTGIAGGASRALVYLNFPVAFAAIALLGVATVALFDQLSPGRRERRLVAAVAIVALVLCLIAAMPGVVRQSDLDARLINALPAIGVLLALAVSIAAMRVSVLPTVPPRTWRNQFAIIASVVLLMLAIPWILADLGVYAGDVPLLGRLVMSKEFVPAGSTLPAVHLGHHHGLDGVCFAASALILGRTLDQFRPGRL
ncbi:MAG TPA: hypothetical protein VFL82_09615, partial [Thermomicrobiales bacterium]|nr:hypothetical protein [Thermomicrobiales bacterium]